MKLMDLTHTIKENMCVFPGTEPPELIAANTIKKDGFRETLLKMYSHTGTHMDAPAHLFDGLNTLDMFAPDQFAGRALIVDCSHLKEGERAAMADVRRYGKLSDEAEYLLFRFGWDAHWGTDRYFSEYPCIDEKIAHYMVETGKKGIGLDTISVDPLADKNLTLHRVLLSTNRMVIVENLCGLREVPEGLFSFFALPLKFARADGAPVRAVAALDKG
ncbi:cyclase family protein [Christensenellaceae bacterium OttesenSCG-928-M15]|nr:cyclase family protein [Christensenellaceae bacterium OttesenSCG-928-M15]